MKVQDNKKKIFPAKASSTIKPKTSSKFDTFGISEKDRFAVYAAAFVLIVFATLAFFIYQSRFMKGDTVSPTYVELKQSIVNDQGIVGRITVTVQVREGDEDWLHDNVSLLEADFMKQLSTQDISVLRTQDGVQELQDDLKRRFNLILKTDKVQAVMVTDLLLQNQRQQ